MVQVRLTGVSKKYGDVPAVEKLDLLVRDREFLTILGPSGGGKSTTLRLIAGLETPDEGDIHIDDLRINELPPRDRNMTMVFQNYALFPHMTAEANIAFPLEVKHTPKEEVEKRVKEVSSLLKISLPERITASSIWIPRVEARGEWIPWPHFQYRVDLLDLWRNLTGE